MSDKPKKEKKEKKPKNKKVKVCPNCQVEIPKSAKVCPSCAAKQKGRSPLLLVIPLLLLLLVGAAGSDFVFHYPVQPPFELPFEIPFLNGPKISETPLGQGMELTAKQEEAVVAVLDQCGFKAVTQVSELTADSTTTSYAVEDVNTERFMMGEDPVVVRLENETKTVQSIAYQENTLYANEEVVSQLTDYYMDMAERDIYMEAAIREVKSQLPLPEVAVFPSRSHWTFTEKEENVLIVESTVTTKDGSGEEKVRPFRARFEDGSLVSVTFQEEETNP